jgi:hypothetical protein
MGQRPSSRGRVMHTWGYPCDAMRTGAKTQPWNEPVLTDTATERVGTPPIVGYVLSKGKLRRPISDQCIHQDSQVLPVHWGYLRRSRNTRGVWVRV